MRRLIERWPGLPALIEDARDGRVHVYSADETPAFVREHYRSRTGKTGAGTYVVRPYLRHLRTYRDAPGCRPGIEDGPVWPVTGTGIDYTLPVVHRVIRAEAGDTARLVVVSDPGSRSRPCLDGLSPVQRDWGRHGADRLGEVMYYRCWGPHISEAPYALAVWMLVLGGTPTYRWRRLVWHIARDAARQDAGEPPGVPMALECLRRLKDGRIVRTDGWGLVVRVYDGASMLIAELAEEPEWLSPHGLLAADGASVTIGHAGGYCVRLSATGNAVEEIYHEPPDWWEAPHIGAAAERAEPARQRVIRLGGRGEP